MIKMVGLLTRKPHLTHEQFVDHWLNVHGPLALAVPGVRRYVQSHIVGTRTRPDIRKRMWKSMGSRNFGMTIWKRLSAPPRHPK
jgi:uncharacterized protein (TIGR02118 family)